jgi:hypothetical protein
MFLQNADLSTYPYKDFIELFDKFPGKIYPWVGNFNECPTGTAYSIFTDSGIRLEGFSEGVCFSLSEREAPERYKNFITGYLEIFDKSYTLYFRRLPTVIYESGRYGVYSRLCVSDLPAIQFANWNYNK